MVLCKFFQQGSCHFGSKCNNEHLDLKQMVKTDVEAAIHGKQWPLSTYGPFRDKPSIPNFVDQSFEEVRLLCYEAKQKNYFEQFHQNFTKAAMDAKNKMNALLQMTPDVVDILTKIYDTPSDAAVTKSAVNSGNPFGVVNSSNSGSIFAKPATGLSTNNLFTNSGNTFASQNQSGSGLFANTSVFAPQQQQPSVFAQATKPTNSIFGVNSSNTNQNTSIFAQPQTQGNLFNSAVQQQTASTGLFSQQNQFMQQNQQSSNIFRQAVQASQPQQGLFAQAAQATQQISTQQGLFAQGSGQTSAGPNLFSQPAQKTQNIFAQTLHPQQQANPNNIFQQTVGNPSQQQGNIFQQNQNIASQQNQTIASQQQISNQQNGPFQQISVQTQSPATQTNLPLQHNSTLYSRLEDLTADEIEAFKADCFLPGKIPFNPPPRELIN